MEVQFNKGVFLPACELWLNPLETRKAAFVSNVHRDFVNWHGQTIATPSMLSIMEASVGAANGRGMPLEFHQSQEFSEFRLTLLPAGNVLGSAQVFIESERGSLLYTSDLMWKGGSFPLITNRVDILVLETIYGQPKYRFPPPEEVIQQIVKFCVEALEEGVVPVLLGVPWGKAEEVFASLAAANLRLILHASTWKWAQRYERAGAHFPSYEPWVFGEQIPGGLENCVLIGPRSAQKERHLATVSRKRVAILTGAAVDPQLSCQLQCDAVFPISERADYESLLQHVEAVAPRQILTFHGFASGFARDLRSRGREAWALCGSNQLEFPISPVVAPRCVPHPEPYSQLERTGFGRFCLLFESVQAAIGKNEKLRLLQRFFRRLSDPELARVCVWLTGRAFPQRNEYSSELVEWPLIRQALIGASGLSEETFQAKAHLYNDPSSMTSHILANQPFRRRVDISDLQAAFIRLSDLRSPLEKSKFLKELLAAVSAVEAQTIVNILVGSALKESLVEESIAAAFACDPQDISEANIILGDIGRTAVLARKNRLETTEMTLFRPIHCMLPSPEENCMQVWERMSPSSAYSRSLWVEKKLDGIRAQVHTDGFRSEIYTRDLRNITALFPEIAQAASRLGRPAVLDGELIAEGEAACTGFFKLQRILGRQESDLFLGPQLSTTFVAFDLLFLDNESLLRKPLCARRAALESLKFDPRLQLVEVIRPVSLEELQTTFQETCARGEEGLITKEPTSSYSPGRRVFSWIKLKKQLTSLDVVVVGAEYDEDDCSRKLSRLTFALRRADGALVIAGQVYNKLTEDETILLTKHFQATALSRNGNYQEVQPTVVVEIEFASVQRSMRYESGLILCLPHLRRIREDKTSLEIDTLETAGKRVSSSGPL